MMILQLVSILSLVLSLISKVYIGDSDYIPGPYSVMIPAGRTSGLYQIPIVVENMTEHDESFRLIIDPMTLPDGIILGSPNDVIVTIENDDSKYPNVHIDKVSLHLKRFGLGSL